MTADQLLEAALGQAPTVGVLLVLLWRLLDVHARTLDTLAGIRSGIEGLRGDIGKLDRNSPDR